MYAQPQTGSQAAATAAPTLHVGTYRRALLRVVVGNPLFTDAEQVLTNHNAHECADAARLARWTRNASRVAAERKVAAEQAAAVPTAAPATAPALTAPLALAPATLADLANPAYVAAHGQRPYGHGLTVADAAAGLESLRRATTPAAPKEWATPAQCDEVFALACKLPAAEKSAALNRLPTLTEADARAFLAGLRLRLAHGRAALWRAGEVGAVGLAVSAEQGAAAVARYVAPRAERRLGVGTRLLRPDEQPQPGEGLLLTLGQN